jgi:hypothetical protein
VIHRRGFVFGGAPPNTLSRCAAAAAAAAKPAPDFSARNEERCRAIFLDASANFAAICALNELPRLVAPHALNCPRGVAEHVARTGAGGGIDDARFFAAEATAGDDDGSA